MLTCCCCYCYCCRKAFSKYWVFKFSIYDEFVGRFLAELPTIELEELPRFVVMGIKNYLRRFDDIATSSEEVIEPELNLEEKLLDTLLPFQLDGIRFVVRHQGRALIGDEMGCGKVCICIELN